MRFSPSSSCSSSTSFSANFCTSKGNTLGCISGFFSRILSLKTQQTYPSDIENRKLFSKIESIVEGSTTPNVVARLMGLEFMPEIISKDDQKDWNSTEKIHVEQKRVKTSFSFKETPNYFELEGDDFLVLSFEDKSHKKKKGRKHCRKKQRKNREEQGKNRVFSDEERLSLKISPQNCQNFENDVHVLKQSYHLYRFKDKISGIKEDENGIKAREKKKKERSLEVSKGGELLENYSPVSVLDDSEFVSDLEVTMSTISEEDAKSRGSECESRELSTTSSSSSNGSSNLDERTREGNEENKVMLKRRDYRKHENIEMLTRVTRLAETELSKWKYKGMFTTQEFEDTVIDFSHNIFDSLINELVDQLVRF